MRTKQPRTPTKAEQQRVCDRRAAGEHPTAIAADMGLDPAAVRKLCADVDHDLERDDAPGR